MQGAPRGKGAHAGRPDSGQIGDKRHGVNRKSPPSPYPRFPGQSGRESFPACPRPGKGSIRHIPKGGPAMAYQLGKNRPVVDDRTMRFATYVKPALPSPPAALSEGATVS